MWIIGLLLLAAAIVVGVEIGISSNDRSVDIEAFSHVWTSNAAAAFLVGVITTVVGVIGIWLMFVSMRHSRVRRGRRRAEADERRAEIEERDRLADERRREIDAMSTAGRGDHYNRTAEDRGVGNRTAATDAPDRDRDDMDRDRVPADRRDEAMDPDRVPADRRDEAMDRDRVPADRRDDVDLRDRRDDSEMRDDVDESAAADEHEAEDHKRHGILHRSNR